MKINEVISEGILGSIAKGIGKGLADVVAPGVVGASKSSIQQAKDYNKVRSGEQYKTAAAELELTKDPEVKAALDKAMVEITGILKKDSLTSDAVPAITLPEITKILAKYGAPANGSNYVADQLTSRGIRVQGYQSPKGSVAALIARDTKITDLLMQRAKLKGSTSMSEIGKAIPQTGMYADKTKRDQKIKDVAKQLASQGIDVKGYQLQAEPEQWAWDSKRGTLSVTGPEGTFTYRKLQDGTWKDEHTAEIIPPSAARELQVQFDTLTGRVAFPGAAPKPKGLRTNQVKEPTTGEIITKNLQDGHWYRADGTTVITSPDALKWLEHKYTLNKQSAHMAKNTITNPSVAV